MISSRWSASTASKKQSKLFKPRTTKLVMVEILFTGTILLILVLLGIFTAVVGWKRRREGKYQETNYMVFFVIVK